MRRLLSFHSSIRRGGAHACRHTCSPRCFFDFSLLCPIRGAGALPQFAPARFLMEVNQDDNHSWYADRDRH
jgi:hypothetical protein